MSIRTKIDFSGITSDHIVTSDNKKYIREDDEIFNSLKDEIAACENAQVQTEIATLQILEIKEQTKVIANEAIDTATERAETAAENAENAQALAETAAINALESERNVTEFSESLAKLDGDNTFTRTNNFTGTLQVGGKAVLTSADTSNFAKTNADNTFTGTNTITGSLTVSGKTTLSYVDANKTIITTQFASPAIRHNNGGALYLFPAANTTFKGGFILRTYKEDNTYVDFQGYNDGLLKWAGKKVICLVESQTDGTNWWRKYSDGWIEQGGYVAKTGAQTITLNTSFSNANYTINATSDGSRAADNFGVNIYAKTSTSFDMYLYPSYRGFHWYACGY